MATNNFFSTHVMLAGCGPQKVFKVMLMLLLPMACIRPSRVNNSEAKTMAPKYHSAFQKQCRGAPKVTYPFPGRDVLKKEYQITRFHRFGPAGPGQPERLVRQELTQVSMSSEGQPCGMAPVSRVSSYLSSDYEADLKYTPSAVRNEEISERIACHFVNQRLYVQDLKSGDKILFTLAPFTDNSPAWAASNYKKSYAVFVVQSVSHSIGAIFSEEIANIEGYFEPVEVDNKQESKVVDPVQLTNLLVGAPLYKGDVEKSELADFIPTGSYGWTQAAFFANRKQEMSGKVYPIFKLVVRAWMP